MSQLHNAPGPKYHIPCTLHLQGWTTQHTLVLFPVARGHKLLPWPMSLLRLRRPNESTHPSFSKSWHCLYSEKLQENYYNTANSASTQILRTYGTHPTPMNSADYVKDLAKDQRAPRTNAWCSRTTSASLDLRISLKKEEKKFATP